jgi:hypothetical protein
MSGSTHRWPAFCLPAVMAMMLSACNSNGSSVPGTAPNNLMPPVSNAFGMAAAKLSPVNTYPGAVIGEPGKFRPKKGDAKSGGHGSKVDGIPCDKTEYLNDYHVHAYLGIVYKGAQIALPAAVGLVHPGPPQSGYITTAGCFYYLHTHDSSGIVHVEDKKNLPKQNGVHPWGPVFDIWGVKLTGGSFGPFKGLVRAYVGEAAEIPGQQTISTYSQMKVADVRSLKILSHQVLWLVIDSPGINARTLPPVTFYMEY